MNISSQQASTGLVQKYIGTAYDSVKKVADEIEGIKKLSSLMGDGVDLSLLAEVLSTLGDSVADLAALNAADLSQISLDIAKGNYLGNRKIDIDLALNNSSGTSEVAYQGITITTTDGVTVPIAFLLSDGETIEELTSYTAIYNALVDGITEYNDNQPNEQLKIVNTEIDIINSTLDDLPTVIRLRDSDGKASSIDRLQLHTYSGLPYETDPVYYWAKTTSALQTLANRIGDVIALGDDIDSIIALSTQRDEIQALYTARDALFGAEASIYSELDVLSNINQNLQVLQDNADTTVEKANEALNSAQSAAIYAQEAAATHAAIQNISVGSTITSDPSENATVVYDMANNQFHFTIPKGTKGDRGEAFTVNQVGVEADKATYDSAAKDFSFLAMDTSLIYFKLSNTSGDWSLGSPFGKGEQGDKGDPGTTDYEDLINKPTEMTPTAHVHAVAQVTGLQAALDDKAAMVHSHGIDEVTGLQTALNAKLEAVDIAGKMDVGATASDSSKLGGSDPSEFDKKVDDIDWGRLVNKPTFLGTGTFTKQSDYKYNCSGSGSLTTYELMAIEFLSSSTFRYRMRAKKYNCNCDCTG